MRSIINKRLILKALFAKWVELLQAHPDYHAATDIPVTLLDIDREQNSTGKT